MEDLPALERRIGYRFADRALLERALTHRSVSGVSASYERLEFLGDAALGLIIAEALFREHPQANEDEMTRARAALVCGEQLASVADHLELGRFVRLGGGERRSGGHHRPSILADVVESLLGAILIESGIEAVRDCVMRWFAEPIASVDPRAHQKDHKTRLQEYLQAEGQSLPRYEIVAESGPDHRRQFTVACRIDGLEPLQGSGSSRRSAEQSAAEAALQQLGQS
ncbi:ribonuclease III [Gammaproteobacteria bacterium]|nr:ribonuclease III [Gammaproteobacteria bacterium]